VSQRGAVRWTVPPEALAGLNFPLALDPVVGPEVDVDEPVAAPAFGNQSQPQSDRLTPTTFLVVWQQSIASQVIMGAVVENDNNGFLAVVGGDSFVVSDPSVSSAWPDVS